MKLIYLTFINCTCKFELHKRSFHSENYEQAFPSKNRKQPNAHAHARATSADRIPRVRCSICIRCSIRSL